MAYNWTASNAWNLKKRHPFGRTHQYLDAELLKSVSVPSLTEGCSKKPPHKGPSPRSPAPKKQAWSTGEEVAGGRVKTVVPFRRSAGRKAPAGVPLLDLSRLPNTDDALMTPLELLPSRAGARESLSTLSWGRVDVRDFNHSRPAASEGAGPEKEEGGEDPDSSGRLTPLPLEVVGVVTEKMEAEQLAISEGTPVAVESQPTNALIRCGGLVSSAADTPGKTRIHFFASDAVPSKRLRFTARILTRCGRDQHRELCGFFFPQDGTLTLYEFKQLGRKASAMSLLSRQVYRAERGPGRGGPYTIDHISKGSTLHLSTAGQPSLPDTLSACPYLSMRVTDVDQDCKLHILMRVTDVDQDCKLQILCEGKSLAEKLALEQRLAGGDVEGGAKKDYSLVKAAQAAVRHRLQSRASKTLLGLGRHLRQEVQRSEVKGVTLSMLQQALRSFHISVTPEDLNTLWRTMDVDAVGHVDEPCVLPCLVGEMSERRKDCVRKLFQRLDAAKVGSIPLSQMKRYFRGNAHPDVTGERGRTAGEVEAAFIELFQTKRTPVHRSQPAQTISWAEFEDYFEGQSIEFPSEEHFTAVVKACWTI